MQNLNPKGQVHMPSAGDPEILYCIRWGYNPHGEKRSKYVGTRHNLLPYTQTSYKHV